MHLRVHVCKYMKQNFSCELKLWGSSGKSYQCTKKSLADFVKVYDLFMLLCVRGWPLNCKGEKVCSTTVLHSIIVDYGESWWVMCVVSVTSMRQSEA